jgi:hypothetical protein
MKHEQVIYGQETCDGWRTIPNYEKYQINRNKEVRAFYRYKGSDISPHYCMLDTKEGRVTLSKDGNKTRFCVDYLYELCFGVEHVENLENEVWVTIKGYEGIYKVSNFGRILSERRFVEKKNGGSYFSKEKLVKPKLINSGYYIVSLKKDLKEKKFLIHRLVAEYFVPNTNNYCVVNHKDEDRLNNNFCNLEWCDRSYNQTYGTSEQRRIATRLKNNNGKYGYKRKVNR